jgi:hypothetical protein
MPESGTPVYPSLTNYMGLDISPRTIALNMPEYSGALSVQPNVSFEKFMTLLLALQED